MMQMIDSGISWIGQIPSNWDKACISYITSSRSGGTPNRNEPLYWENGTIPWMSSGEVNKEIVWDTNEKITELGSQNSSAKILQPNSVMVALNGQGKTKGMTAILKIAAACNQSLCAIQCNGNILYYKYLFFCFKAMYKYLRSQAGDDVRDGLAASFVIKQIIPLPPLDKQFCIAEYLDKQCTNINGIIEKCKASIGDYKTLKQSVITEAVTKGIRGERPMKDSGINWLKEVPEDWTIVRFKTLVSFRKGLNITKENLVESGVPVISYGQIHSKNNKGTGLNESLFRYVPESYLETDTSCLVKKHDFLFADTSEDYEGCGNCVYVDDDNTLFAGYHTIIAASNNDDDKKYLAYQILTDGWRSQIRSKVWGIKVFSVSRGLLSNAYTILPSAEEQAEISSYLDQKCSMIDSLIERKEMLIKELESYKKSLIYEYVTGKKEV